ncbi:MAG TPA: serine protease [Rubrivivax sp.]|nr:serine protease [Rubrivivax sp.]
MTILTPRCARLALVLLMLTPMLAMAGLEEIIVAAKPSVVAVGTFNATSNPRFGFRGTGFVVGKGDMVITNAHVLPEVLPAETQTVLAIQTPKGATEAQLRNATLLGLDRARDLALLRIEGAALPALPLADDTRLREGMSVAIIGYPIGGALGFTPVTHRGIISSITAIALPAPTSQALNAQAIKQLRQGSFDIYQLDATVYPGNSGSPVFDVATGQVVAVINMVLVKGSKESALTHPSGISYAIPVRFVIDLLKDR